MTDPQAPATASMMDKLMHMVMQGMAGMHRFLYRSTGGKIGYNFRGGHILLLTTTGRKTGKARTWPLMYFTDGDRLVVVGSNGGLDRDPAWCLNLRSNPHAHVEIGRKQLAMHAEEAQGNEWDRLWQLVVTQAPMYDGYRTSISRRIPLMVLTTEAQTIK